MNHEDLVKASGDAERAARELYDAQFTRTILFSLAACFMLIASFQHVQTAFVFGLLGLVGFLYFHLFEVQKLRLNYEAAQRRFLQALWAMRLPQNQE